MEYRINKSNYHRFEAIEVNRLSPRSYFIPFPDRKSQEGIPLIQKRYSSAKVRCLNGLWDFVFYERPADLPDLFDTDRVAFKKIPVPSCWQYQGYGRAFYLNSRYQFAFDPPNIPKEEPVGKVFYWQGYEKGFHPVTAYPENEYNSAGVYRHTFEIEDPSLRYELSFLGVSSCMDLYINGLFAGYSEGSHNTAEFDISDWIREGTNEMLVVVRRWCTGSYLECQDMFRNNGIFRDVLLRISNPVDIRDVGFKTIQKNGDYYAYVSCSFYTNTGCDVAISLSGHGLNRSETVSCANGKAALIFKNLEITEWTAENPILYDLCFEIPGTFIRCRVGFKNVEIDGSVLKLNGKKIKLKGVNHHDTSPTNGYTMTPEEIERDMLLCKEFNIDTIRTSHYPSDPLLLELCDELGIYVIDEADIETHGAYYMKLPPDYGRISNDPNWTKHYMDRLRAMYGRDRNHPCILMWSLGNESGGYHCQDQMAAWIKKHSDLPVHYEGAVHCRRHAYDIASRMYPPHSELKTVGKKKHRFKEFNNRPYFMCEYLHAMGTGPGGGEEYWEEIYRYDNLCGGCVWEFADHAFTEADGHLTYGGDHGEWEHDGNFCVDGLFYPDRKPSTGAYVIRHLYRPLRVTHVGNGDFAVFNTCSFSNARRYSLTFLFSDGHSVTCTPEADPFETVHVKMLIGEFLNLCKKENIDGFVSVITKDSVSGREVSCEQILLHEAEKREYDTTKRSALSSYMRENGGRPYFYFRTDPDEILMKGTSPLLFRAPTDNDNAMFLPKIRMQTFIQASEKILSADYSDTGFFVTSKITLPSASFQLKDSYEPTQNGVLFTSVLKPAPLQVRWLPRFGRTFVLDRSFTEVEYFGRAGETYADMRDHFPIRKVNCTVSDMTEPNIRPQESGNRCDCRFASVSNGIWRVTFTAVDSPFELGIKPYSDRELLHMRHREDEVVTGTYVTLSAFQSGIGTGSCGPQTLDQYCYPGSKPYSLRVLIEISRCQTRPV